MIITKIERQKKNKLRFSVFIDDVYAFSVSEDVYARFVLHQGQELTDAERDEIERSETEVSVRQSALRFRSYRPRSTKEIVDHLQKKGFDETNIRQAVTYLIENKLLNDEEFARMLCRDKMTLRPLGKLSMKQLLFKKGIERNIVDRILAEFYTAESENALALKEAERKYKRVASLPVITKKKRIYEHLVRRGYDSSLSLKIAAQLVNK